MERIVVDDEKLTVAVVGCTHGELDVVYESVSMMEKDTGSSVDIVLCLGDFQAVRDASDLQSMAVPAKHRKMMDFSKYYKEKKAPYLTVFIGGNHEASAYMCEVSNFSIAFLFFTNQKVLASSWWLGGAQHLLHGIQQCSVVWRVEDWGNLWNYERLRSGQGTL